MQSDEIRKRFLTFFTKRGHAIIPSASLIPEGSSSVLFTIAGMQQFAPYLLGKSHPAGTRLVDIQKCLRTGDIEEVGDNTHHTFFEMLGNWSLGDYFKKEMIPWSYELLTSKEEGFGLDPNRLYITVYEGDEEKGIPKDTESFELWKQVGVSGDRIYFLGAADNWWPAVKGKDEWTGPTGPSSEMFYDRTDEGLGLLTKEEFLAATDDQRVVEIWNDVFMEYEKREGVIVGKLEKNNIDTGAGLERIAAILQNVQSAYETDIFKPILDKIEELSAESASSDEKAQRIVADHVRAAVFMIADGIIPSNTDRGYILRRLLRRAVRNADKLGMKHGTLFWIAQAVIDKYAAFYPEVKEKEEQIKSEIDKEESKFRKTLEAGFKELNKIIVFAARYPRESHEEFRQRLRSKLEQEMREKINEMLFTLVTAHGFPWELSVEELADRGFLIDEEYKHDFKERMKKHQELSRAGAEQKFKGGLAGTGEMETKYHTATHLLNAALKQVLGSHVKQKGSNITAERLRFDFSHPQKLTDEEKKRVEDLMNEKISAALNVVKREMPREEAEKIGAEMEFGVKYPDIVSVYSIEDEQGSAFSKEFCGGPHVKNTSELGHFKITKEEAVSAGVRRIKAVLG